MEVSDWRQSLFSFAEWDLGRAVSSIGTAANFLLGSFLLKNMVYKQLSTHKRRDMYSLLLNRVQKEWGWCTEMTLKTCAAVLDCSLIKQRCSWLWVYSSLILCTHSVWEACAGVRGKTLCLMPVELGT